MSRHHRSVLVSIVAMSLALPAAAMETEITIDQDKATAGGITPGDYPGFPISLTQPGRYVLKSNLYPPATVSPHTGAIWIQSHDVIIDFNGFRLQGFGQAQVSGIFSAPGGGDTATIMNGVIAGFKGNAIEATKGSFWTIENMRILDNGGAAVFVENWARVQNNIIAFNRAGIVCGEGCLIEGNNINSNAEDGVEVFASGTILGNAIINNLGFGIKADAQVGRVVGFRQQYAVGKQLRAR